MARRAFRVSAGLEAKCPECGNGHLFTARSEQCAEDLCEIWVICGLCGHDPFGMNDKIEDVWGSLDEGSVREALDEWIRLVEEQAA